MLLAESLQTQPLTHQELVAVALGFARAQDGWRHQIQYDENDRYTFLLHADDDVDIWLCTWLAGQRTSLHDHGGSAGAIAVVTGQLTESRLARGGRIGRRRIRAGRSSLVTPNVVHDVRNDKQRPAVSIHAYSPPLTRMSFYDREGIASVSRLRTVDLMAAASWEAHA
ncbi:MAG: hypothetical protein QOG53_2322 [Frankiales bacterium]|jgi:predicted metal-dependent enzyme (double-stranded beta helix superfamily)|nr:hypothetical protein [Frankiales bacterium]